MIPLSLSLSPQVHAGNYEANLYQVEPDQTSLGLWRVGDIKHELYGRFARAFHGESSRNEMYFRLNSSLWGNLPLESARLLTLCVAYWASERGVPATMEHMEELEALTWNSRPALGQVLMTFQLESGDQYTELDVTQLLADDPTALGNFAIAEITDLDVSKLVNEVYKEPRLVTYCQSV